MLDKMVKKTVKRKLTEPVDGSTGKKKKTALNVQSEGNSPNLPKKKKKKQGIIANGDVQPLTEQPVENGQLEKKSPVKKTAIQPAQPSGGEQILTDLQKRMLQRTQPSEEELAQMEEERALRQGRFSGRGFRTPNMRGGRGGDRRGGNRRDYGRDSGDRRGRGRGRFAPGFVTVPNSIHVDWPRVTPTKTNADSSENSTDSPERSADSPEKPASLLKPDYNSEEYNAPLEWMGLTPRRSMGRGRGGGRGRGRGRERGGGGARFGGRGNNSDDDGDGDNDGEERRSSFGGRGGRGFRGRGGGGRGRGGSRGRGGGGGRGRGFGGGGRGRGGRGGNSHNPNLIPVPSKDKE